MPFAPLNLVNLAQSLVLPELQTSDGDPRHLMVPEPMQKLHLPAMTFDFPYSLEGTAGSICIFFFFLAQIF